jgi:exosortase
VGEHFSYGAFCILHAAGKFAEDLTLPLRMLAVTSTRVICHGLLDIDVVQQGTALLDAQDAKFTTMTWWRQCSGIRSFVALLAVTTVFAMLSLRSVWKRALMIVTTVPLVIFCNVLRLVVVVLVTQAYGQAGMWVHDWFGFVTYLVAIGSLLVLAHWLKEKPSPASRMNKSKWLVLAAALGMMAATGAYLANLHQRLGRAGGQSGAGLAVR